MARSCLLLALVLTIIGAAAGVNAAQDKPAAQTGPGDLSGLHDFDFLVGEWRVHSRRLKERLTGSTDWEEFEGTIVCRQYMDGWGTSTTPCSTRRKVSIVVWLRAPMTPRQGSGRSGGSTAAIRLVPWIRQ